MAKNDVNEIKISSLNQVVGQNSVKKLVEVALQASRFEGTKFPDSAFFGPPGLGKSMLANAIAEEMGTGFHEVLGQSIKTSADFHGLLMKAKDRDIILFEEAHLLDKAHMTQLLFCMDKKCISITASKKIINLPLPGITYFFATTDSQKLVQPLIDRCRLVLHYNYYTVEEIETILLNRLRELQWKFEAKIIQEIAARSRYTPRISLRLLSTCRQVALAEQSTTIKLKHVLRAFELTEIDCLGLDKHETKILHLLKDTPLRLNVIASMVGVDKAIVSRCEEYLQRIGLLVKDDIGRRCLTQEGQDHIRS